MEKRIYCSKGDWLYSSTSKRHFILFQVFTIWQYIVTGLAVDFVCLSRLRGHICLFYNLNNSGSREAFCGNEGYIPETIQKQSAKNRLQPQEKYLTSEVTLTSSIEVDTPPLKMNDPVDQRDIGKHNCTCCIHETILQTSFPTMIN